MLPSPPHVSRHARWLYLRHPQCLAAIHRHPADKDPSPHSPRPSPCGRCLVRITSPCARDLLCSAADAFSSRHPSPAPRVCRRLLDIACTRNLIAVARAWQPAVSWLARLCERLTSIELGCPAGPGVLGCTGSYPPGVPVLPRPGPGAGCSLQRALPSAGVAACGGSYAPSARLCRAAGGRPVLHLLLRPSGKRLRRVFTAWQPVFAAV
jgi:hypothetical protein